MELTNGEKRLIKYLKGKGYVRTDKIFMDLEQSEATSSISWLKEKRLVTTLEKPLKLYVLGPEGKKLVNSTLPEEKLMEYYSGGITKLSELQKKMKSELRYGLAQVFKKGGKVVNGVLILDDTDKISRYISQTKRALEKANAGVLSNEEAKPILERKGFITEKVKIERLIKLTKIGERINEIDLEEREDINQITPEIIENYNEKMLIRPYDPTLYSPRYLPGKIHPLSEFIEEVREAMLEMGFFELKGNIVETAFWNMDVLFIPQDHPAREMQDTIYVKGNKKLNKNEVKIIKNVHENGIGSSKGWQYSWSEEEASKLLLRTHTTVNTIRYLIEHKNEECKIFSVEKIFRRENVDSSHLSEFSQVEGVIGGKGITFGVLIETLESFYHKIGVKDVRIKPSYFPYTEPSLEVYGKFMGKELELGGAGMFRPEVLKPWGISYNVAAWGLGLERLLMMTLGLDDIRDIYRNDLLFLKERKVLKNVL